MVLGRLRLLKGLSQKRPNPGGKMNGIGESRGESVGGCDAVSPAEGESQTDGWWAEKRHPPAIHGSIIKDQKKRILEKRHRR